MSYFELFPNFDRFSEGFFDLSSTVLLSTNYRISGIFARRENLAKMTLCRRVEFSLSPTFAISRTVNEDG